MFLSPGLWALFDIRKRFFLVLTERINGFPPDFEPASVAQLEVHPFGDQEVAGYTPTRSATFFHGD